MRAAAYLGSVWSASIPPPRAESLLPRSPLFELHQAMSYWKHRFIQFWCGLRLTAELLYCIKIFKKKKGSVNLSGPPEDEAKCPWRLSNGSVHYGRMLGGPINLSASLLGHQISFPRPSDIVPPDQSALTSTPPHCLIFLPPAHPLQLGLRLSHSV